MRSQWLMGLGIVGSVCLMGAADVIAAELPTVDSATLGTRRSLPWSQPVQVEDPFEGNFIGVFDRHSFRDRFLDTTASIEVQSLWSADFIRVLSIIRDRDCLSSSFHHSPNLSCSEFSNARNIVQLFVKVDDTVFEVAGENNTFPVSGELAQALHNAPKAVIDIRLVAESGESIDSKIGEGTGCLADRIYNRIKKAIKTMLGLSKRLHLELKHQFNRYAVS